MGGIALLARELGHQVSGSDANIYPPMSTQLEHSGITLYDGYRPEHLQRDRPDLVIIGNVLSRGNPAVEYVLNQGLRYRSGPEWLAEHVLPGRHVLAVAGTHGKTTTTAMLAWVLDQAGKRPGFLIGGVAENFGVSTRLGGPDYFVVEADEYDTAFFDKRSKFLHYQPKTLIITNIEYDHADIFADIGDIVREFSRLLRIVPETGQIIYKHEDAEIRRVFASGCWSPRISFGSNAGVWQCQVVRPDYSEFTVLHEGRNVAAVKWKLIGQHNAENALAVMAAAAHVGVGPMEVAGALAGFQGVKRRLQRIAEIDGIGVYDDFAHHPTAIRVTLEALRMHVGRNRIIAVLEPRSNTMKLGVNSQALAPSLEAADRVMIYRPAGLAWDIQAAVRGLGDKCRVFDDTGEIITALTGELQRGDQVIIMSNGGFQGIHGRLIAALEQQRKNN
jgi:UDP-N-acetylmuramate: L-alanyl-gamma-D-glutamyl-meso-diaminopimelate ligase